MAYKTCPDCGSRVYEYGCVNCNEEDYIAMQEYDNDRLERINRIEKTLNTSPSSKTEGDAAGE